MVLAVINFRADVDSLISSSPSYFCKLNLDLNFLFNFNCKRSRVSSRFRGGYVMNLVPFLNLYSFCLFCPVVSFCHSPICIISETWLTDRS